MSFAKNVRKFDTKTTLLLIGAGNVFAVSGGRYERVDGALILPVGYGYSVRITLAANDTFTVERVYKRGFRWTIKTVTDVHAAELGEIVYRASLHNSLPDFGVKTTV